LKVYKAIEEISLGRFEIGLLIFFVVNDIIRELGTVLPQEVLFGKNSSINSSNGFFLTFSSISLSNFLKSKSLSGEYGVFSILYSVACLNISEYCSNFDTSLFSS